MTYAWTRVDCIKSVSDEVKSWSSWIQSLYRTLREPGGEFTSRGGIEELESQPGRYCAWWGWKHIIDLVFLLTTGCLGCGPQVLIIYIGFECGDTSAPSTPNWLRKLVQIVQSRDGVSNMMEQGHEERLTASVNYPGLSSSMPIATNL
ncbi:hypothetical protein PM082_013623 [Marasmius tenuissimus]|nr:hypothetical protein PM082_013623 [Marasmius tenuissimus]